MTLISSSGHGPNLLSVWCVRSIVLIICTHCREVQLHHTSLFVGWHRLTYWPSGLTASCSAHVIFFFFFLFSPRCCFCFAFRCQSAQCFQALRGQSLQCWGETLDALNVLNVGRCNITIKFEELLFSFVSGERAVSSCLSLCLCNILLCVFLCVLVNVPSLGMVSEGIYRKSGVNSRVAALCERFRHDARSLCLREGEHQVDDVSNTLKRFFRELKEGVFTTQDSPSWLSTASKSHTILFLHDSYVSYYFTSFEYPVKHV